MEEHLLLHFIFGRDSGKMSRIYQSKVEKRQKEWDGIVPFYYPEKALHGITKLLIVGQKDLAERLELRVFIFEPGSKSDISKHPKENIFFILEGRALLQINNDKFELKPYDVAFVSKDDLIQISAIGDETLKFIDVTEISSAFS